MDHNFNQITKLKINNIGDNAKHRNNLPEQMLQRVNEIIIFKEEFHMGDLQVSNLSSCSNIVFHRLEVQTELSQCEQNNSFSIYEPEVKMTKLMIKMDKSIRYVIQSLIE